MKILTVVFLFLLTGCNDKVVDNTLGFDEQDEKDKKTDTEWLIPVNEVYDGGPGKDGIPSIDNPKFISSEEVNFLKDEDLVVVIKIGNEIKVYPHLILDWHEIVNDKVAFEFVALTYCPLTGSAIAWNRVVDRTLTTFGVSGLLYNSNLIPYDRHSNSNWSQMLNKSVNGKVRGESIKRFSLIETKWKTIKNLPGIKVLSTDTGFSRNYGLYPYGDYRSNHSKLIFPVNNQDVRLSAKIRVLGVISDNTSLVVPETIFGDEFKSFKTTLGSQNYFVFGSRNAGLFLVFHSLLIDGREVNLEVSDKLQFPDMISDADGNVWNIFGENVVSLTTNKNLRTPADSFMAYWFAWAAFYPDAAVIGNDGLVNK